MNPLKLIDKLNPINAILRLLFRVRWKSLRYNVAVRGIREGKIFRYYTGSKQYFVNNFGWHRGFPWGAACKWEEEIFTTYGYWEWTPNSRIDFYMSLDKNDDWFPGYNTSAWGIIYYEDMKESDPSMHEIDVIEVMSGDKLLFHVHTISDYPEGERIQRGYHMKTPKGFDVREKHLYSVKWKVKKVFGVKFVYIIHYVDNIPVQILTNLFSRLPDRSVYPAISYGEDCTEWVQYKKI